MPLPYVMRGSRRGRQALIMEPPSEANASCVLILGVGDNSVSNVLRDDPQNYYVEGRMAHLRGA